MRAKQAFFPTRVLLIAKNLLALFIGIAVAICLLEIILRIYNPIQSTVRGNRIILPVNQKTIFKNKIFTKLDQTIIHSKNSLGFRGSEPPTDFDRYLTIITVGGSTTEDRLLSDGKTWSEHLERGLQEEFSKVWVNNAGFDGHSTRGHIVLTEDYLSKINPKIVVFLIGLNDIFLRQELNHWELNRIRGRILTRTFKEFVKSASSYSEVLSTSLNLYRHYRAQYAGLLHAEVNILNVPQVEIDDQFKHNQINKHNWNLLQYQERLEQLNRACSKNSIEPIFLTQPALYGPCIDKATGVNLSKIRVFNNYNGGFMWEVLQMYNSITKDFAQRNGYLVIDLAEQLEKTSRYFYDFTHYTNEGAAEVGRIVARGLKNHLRIMYPWASHL